MPSAKTAAKKISAKTTRAKTGVRIKTVNVTVYRSKAIGSNWSSLGDLVCETTGGCLLIKERTTGTATAVFAPGQWVTVNVAPI